MSDLLFLWLRADGFKADNPPVLGGMHLLCLFCPPPLLPRNHDFSLKVKVVCFVRAIAQPPVQKSDSMIQPGGFSVSDAGQASLTSQWVCLVPALLATTERDTPSAPSVLQLSKDILGLTPSCCSSLSPFSYDIPLGLCWCGTNAMRKLGPVILGRLRPNIAGMTAVV